MAVSLSVVVAKDGAGATIVGGLQAQDKSGAGTGPFTLGHIMIDGLAGTNMAAVTAANAVKVDGSAVTQPVSLTSTTITGTVAATQSGAWQITNSGNSAQAQVVANGDALANQVGVSANSQTQVYNGATWDRLRGDTTNGAFVNVKNIAAGAAIIGKVGIDQTTDGTTNKVAADLRLAGTAAAAGSGATTAATVRTVLATDSPGIITTGSQASPSSSYLSTVAAGDVAAAASDSGNPVKIGGVGKTANPIAVTDGQRVNSLFDKLGKQVTVGAIRDLKGMQSTTITSSTSETTIVTAVAATFLDLYGLVITNTSATVTKVTIKDSTAGTTRAVFEIPATETRGFMLPVDSALAQATVNTSWTATCGTSVASVEIGAFYVKNI